MRIVIALLFAYLIGAIPFAVIAGYLIQGEDIRTKGSGNAGATNVWRVLGWKPAIIVFILDFMKAFLPVFWFPNIPYIRDYIDLSNSLWNKEMLQISLLFFVVIGHVFPIWLKFRGGKGVASLAGGVTALFPLALLFCVPVFSLTLAVTRYVSLASLITTWSLPIYYMIFCTIKKTQPSFLLLIFFLLMAGLLTIFHRGNIRRIIKGEESKIRRITSPK